MSSEINCPDSQESLTWTRVSVSPVKRVEISGWAVIQEQSGNCEAPGPKNSVLRSRSSSPF
jgi:hypothetical protein